MWHEASGAGWERRPNGPAAAAILAAGIGSFVLGSLTTLAQASKGVSAALNFSSPVGPLAGKSTLAVAAYLVAWVILALWWRGKDVRFEFVWAATLILLGLGLLGTFPLFFELFPSR
jgi:hypothetical protein